MSFAILASFGSLASAAPATPQKKDQVQDPREQAAEETEEAGAEQPEPIGPPTKVESGKIVQISAKAPRAKVLFSNSVPAGAGVSVIDSAGNECAGQITEAKANVALADFSNCSTFSKVKVGNVVKATIEQASAADEAAIKAAMPAAEGHTRTFRFSAAITYDSSSQIVFNSVSGNYASGFTSIPFSGSATYQMNTTPGLNLEVLMDQPHRLGFHAGVNFEYPRAINSTNYNLVGGGQVLSNSGSLSGANISFITFYGDISYRFSGIFLELGPNVVDVAGSVPTALGSPQPGFGGQVGGGYYITENIAIELIGRYISFTSNSTVAANGLNVTLGSTQLISANLGIKLIL